MQARAVDSLRESLGLVIRGGGIEGCAAPCRTPIVMMSTEEEPSHKAIRMQATGTDAYLCDS